MNFQFFQYVPLGDILGADLIIVARTDAEAATLLDNNIDGRDHPFILGIIKPISQFKSAPTEKDFFTFSEAVEKKIQDLKGVIPERNRLRMLEMWKKSDPDTLSNANARRIADVIFGEKDSVSIHLLL